jgi:DNA anti-recombination protein RmuC
MDDEKFRQDTMLGIARIELALQNLDIKLAEVQANCKEEDSDIISELKDAVRKLEEECNRKRKNILENLTSADVRTENVVRDILDGLDGRVRVLEERVLGVEKQNADKTTTRVVVSMEAKIDRVAESIGDIKVDMGRMDERLEAVEKSIAEMRDSGWKRLQAVLTIIALILSGLALSYNTIKDILKAPQAQQQVQKPADPDK